MAAPDQNSVDTVLISSIPSSLGAAKSLIQGHKWGSSGDSAGVALTWSVPNGTAYYDDFYSYFSEWDDWSSFSETEAVRAGKALKTWTDVSGVSVTRVADNQAVAGEIRFAKTSFMISDEYAHAYYPSENPSSGDVWMSPGWGSGKGAPLGSYDYLTLIHEIGHALGLKHPFETSSDNSTTASSTNDSFFHTVMSYSVKPGYSGNADFYPTTPMYLDLVAIQYLYGRIHKPTSATRNTHSSTARNTGRRSRCWRKRYDHL